jgi:hypothetical protein
MHIVITSTSDIDLIFDYCAKYHIEIVYGRVYNNGVDDIAWQIVCESTPAVDLLLILFSESVSVVRA